MDEVFRHLYMPPQLACQFLAVFSRLEYALKATADFAEGDEDGVRANWDRFGNSINTKFLAIGNEQFSQAVDYFVKRPPRKQVLRNGAIDFKEQAIAEEQALAQQVLLMIRTVRNNLFHGGKHLPDGEAEAGRNEKLVDQGLLILKHCVYLDDRVRSRYEY